MIHHHVMVVVVHHHVVMMMMHYHHIGGLSDHGRKSQCCNQERRHPYLLHFESPLCRRAAES